MAAGFDPLYPFVGKDSPAGKKLTAFMEKVGMGEEERNVIGTLVWLMLRRVGQRVRLVPYIFSTACSRALTRCRR